jgi:hypothetical protein
MPKTTTDSENRGRQIALRMKSDPLIPNQPDLTVEVIAWAGEFHPGTHKRYYCRSFRIRVDRHIYSPDVKAKLEDGTAWEILDTSQAALPEKGKGSWEIVRRARFSVHFPKSENVWPLICRVIREDFPRRSKMVAEARIIEY